MQGDGEKSVGIEQLGEGLCWLRLRQPTDVAAVQRSLQQAGQLSAVVAFDDGGQLELIDGFKRLLAARRLGWTSLRVRIAQDCDTLEAKVRICGLHAGRRLTPLEQGWLVQSLYRQHRLSQPQIARRIGKDKSWVCRRLMLAESLHPELQAQTRLGLLTSRTAMEISRLSRDNQLAAADVVIKRGLSVRQAQLLVTELLGCARQGQAARLLKQWTERQEKARARPLRKAVSEADRICGDIRTVHQTSARLQARLMSRPAVTFAPQVCDLLVHALNNLLPVIRSLHTTIEGSLTKQSAGVEQGR